MITRENIRNFYASYASDALAEILADLMYDGKMPALPAEHVLETYSFPRKRGRPTPKKLGEAVDRITRVLADAYPTDVSLSYVSLRSGLSLPQVLRLRDSADVALLPDSLRDYFLAIPTQDTPGRINAVWRAVLDLHNYLMALTYPGELLNLFALHAPLWWGRARNAAAGGLPMVAMVRHEYERLYAPAIILLRERNGWPELPTPPDGIGKLAGSSNGACANQCVLVGAFLRGDAPKTLGDAHHLASDGAWYVKGTAPLRLESGVRIEYSPSTQAILEELIVETEDHRSPHGAVVEPAERPARRGGRPRKDNRAGEGDSDGVDDA